MAHMAKNAMAIALTMMSIASHILAFFVYVVMESGPAAAKSATNPIFMKGFQDSLSFC
jgi:hypothetical protein